VDDEKTERAPDDEAGEGENWASVYGFGPDDVVPTEMLVKGMMSRKPTYKESQMMNYVRAYMTVEEKQRLYEYMRRGGKLTGRAIMQFSRANKM